MNWKPTLDLVNNGPSFPLWCCEIFDKDYLSFPEEKTGHYFLKRERRNGSQFFVCGFCTFSRKNANLAAIVRNVCGGFFYFRSHIYSFSIVPGVDKPLHM